MCNRGSGRRSLGATTPPDNTKPPIIRQEHSAPSIYAARWTNLEAKAREGIQSMLQDLLEAEVTEFLARPRYARRSQPAAERVFRNGHGKPRRLSLTSGTVTVRRT